MTTDLMALAERVEAIDKSMAPAPWSKSALYSAIRHIQRNTDVMEQSIEYQDPGEPEGMPDRYDGTALAELRNLLPELAAALRAHATKGESDAG